MSTRGEAILVSTHNISFREILMSMHNICFYGELTKITLQLSSNTHLIYSTTDDPIPLGLEEMGR